MASVEPRPIDRKGVALFAVPMTVFTILGWIGDGFAPSLIDEAPLGLVALAPRTRNLVLASPEVGILPFVAVAVGRLLLSDPLFFWFGRRYGDATIRWMERQLGAGATWILWIEKAFKKAGYPMVALMPNNWICILAGATAMNVWAFALLNVGGTLARILLIRSLGDAFADPILGFNDWIGDNRWWLTPLTVILVLVTILHSMRTGRNPIETPAELAEELEEAAQEVGEPARGEIQGPPPPR